MLCLCRENGYEKTKIFLRLVISIFLQDRDISLDKFVGFFWRNGSTRLYGEI